MQHPALDCRRSAFIRNQRWSENYGMNSRGEITITDEMWNGNKERCELQDVGVPCFIKITVQEIFEILGYIGHPYLGRAHFRLSDNISALRLV